MYNIYSMYTKKMMMIVLLPILLKLTHVVLTMMVLPN